MVSLTEAKSSNVFLLLLVEGGSRVRITEKAFAAAVSVGTTLMALLLEERGNEFKITEDIAVAAARSSELEEMQLLVRERGHEFAITENVIHAILRAGSASGGVDMIRFLLDERGVNFKVTENIVKIIATKAIKSQKLLGLLLDKRRNEFKITDDVAQAILHSGSYRILAKIFIEMAGDGFKITEEMIQRLAESAAPEVYDAFEKLFEARNTDVPITEGIVESAAVHHGESSLRLLMSNAASRGQLSKDLVEAAASGGLMLMEDGTWSYLEKPWRAEDWTALDKRRYKWSDDESISSFFSQPIMKRIKIKKLKSLML